MQSSSSRSKNAKDKRIFNKIPRIYSCGNIIILPEHKYDGNSIIKYDSPELNQIVPLYSNFAYDVAAHIGISRFLHHKQKSEIQHELKIEYGIKISDSGITHLSDNFLTATVRSRYDARIGVAL